MSHTISKPCYINVFFSLLNEFQARNQLELVIGSQKKGVYHCRQCNIFIATGGILNEQNAYKHLNSEHHKSVVLNRRSVDLVKGSIRAIPGATQSSIQHFIDNTSPVRLVWCIKCKKSFVEHKKNVRIHFRNVNHEGDAISTRNAEDLLRRTLEKHKDEIQDERTYVRCKICTKNLTRTSLSIDCHVKTKIHRNLFRISQEILVTGNNINMPNQLRNTLKHESLKKIAAEFEGIEVVIEHNLPYFYCTYCEKILRYQKRMLLENHVEGPRHDYKMPYVNGKYTPEELNRDVHRMFTSSK